jgi:hypothetical protein
MKSATTNAKIDSQLTDEESRVQLEKLLSVARQSGDHRAEASALTDLGVLAIELSLGA